MELGFTNSPLVSYTKISPNRNSPRLNKIDIITPHCFVGQVTVERLGKSFESTSAQTSCNYGIGFDGRVGMYVEEKDRSWCSSNRTNDHMAVTIECASDSTAPYAFKDVVYEKLIELCTDICRRNGKTILLWFGDKTDSINYKIQPHEMLLTVHRWFANKSCPGDWMYSRMADLAEKVTYNLCGDSNVAKPAEPATPEQENVAKTEEAESKCPYRVKVSIDTLNIRKGPGTNHSTTGKYTGKGVFTIVEESAGVGSDKGWGKLKSGAGWISLDFVTKV